jgi:hypothetical protein
MTRRTRRATVIALLVAACLRAGSAEGQQPVGLSGAIDRLGSFDFETRMAAARAVRRAPGAEAVPVLERAVRAHKDEYVRFRAMVVLAGFGAAGAAPVMRDMLTDRNDRLRTVAYQWFEHHPSPTVLPALLDALPRERSEFVRPALTRALAAHGSDARAREALLPLVMKGEDLFRGALIEALGDYKAQYAVAAIAEVAGFDGPLQDDAITALGKTGNPSVRPTLAAVQRTAPREVQPTLSAAFCLLGIDCERQEAYLRETVAFAAADPEYQPLLRGVAHALGVLAVSGRAWALDTLIDVGVRAAEPVRAPVALSLGLVAIRDPARLVSAVEKRPEVASVVSLLLEAFDMLSEDFEEERFYVAVRQIYWDAPAGSATRRTAEVLIEGLEF